MTKAEFDRRLKDLQAEFDNKKKTLLCEYATSNNTIAIGDVICDHIGMGRVEKVQVCACFNGYSEMRYLCTLLKKDGTPRKDESVGWKYQSNVKEVNGKRVE